MTETRACEKPGCDLQVVDVLTVHNRRWPVDPTPHPDGTVVLETQADGTVRARVLSGWELPAQTPAYVMHERSCAWVSPKEAERRARAKPKCGICHYPMAVWCLENNGGCHINCGAPMELGAAYERLRRTA